MHDIIRSIQIFRPFENARLESLEAREVGGHVLFVSACDVFAETALASLSFSLFLLFFEIKNSILSVARYTRGIVYFVTQAGESRYSTSTCGARCEIMISQAFPDASAFNSTVPLLHYLRALTTPRLKF